MQFQSSNLYYSHVFDCTLPIYENFMILYNNEDVSPESYSK